MDAGAFAQGDAKRGAYLAKAAGCEGCHTEKKDGAAPYAGGRELKTPFGIFYGPNITPHAEAGIGRWSEADFARALREGVCLLHLRNAMGTAGIPCERLSSFFFYIDLRIYFRFGLE